MYSTRQYLKKNRSSEIKALDLPGASDFFFKFKLRNCVQWPSAHRDRYSSLQQSTLGFGEEISRNPHWLEMWVSYLLARIVRHGKIIFEVIFLAFCDSSSSAGSCWLRREALWRLWPKNYVHFSKASCVPADLHCKPRRQKKNAPFHEFIIKIAVIIMTGGKRANSSFPPQDNSLV